MGNFYKYSTIALGSFLIVAVFLIVINLAIPVSATDSCDTPAEWAQAVYLNCKSNGGDPSTCVDQCIDFCFNAYGSSPPGFCPNHGEDTLNKCLASCWSLYIQDIS